MLGDTGYAMELHMVCPTIVLRDSISSMPATKFNKHGSDIFLAKHTMHMASWYCLLAKAYDFDIFILSQQNVWKQA